MADKEEKKEVKEEEKVVIRHTINAEETFTLAKDLYDIRCFVKNVYSNRAVILRRLNILTMTASLIFTLLYVAFVACTGILGRIPLGQQITVYVLFGVFGALFITLVALALAGFNASPARALVIRRTMSVFRLLIRLVSLAMAIIALVLSGVDGYAAKNIALDVILILISVICIVFQVLPLLFGGIAKLSRWLLSPVKVKRRLYSVAEEWYEDLASGESSSESVKKVDKKLVERVGEVLNNYVVPSFGKKYINSIKSAQVYSVAAHAPEADRPLVEGVLKSLFTYAAERGYVTFNPCRDLQLEGTIEKQAKQKKTFKSRLAGLGRRIGKSLLDKYVLKPGEEAPSDPDDK